jgi:hypothetical protein
MAGNVYPFKGHRGLVEKKCPLAGWRRRCLGKFGSELKLRDLEIAPLALMLILMCKPGSL